MVCQLGHRCHRFRPGHHRGSKTMATVAHLTITFLSHFWQNFEHNSRSPNQVGHRFRPGHHHGSKTVTTYQLACQLGHRCHRFRPGQSFAMDDIRGLILKCAGYSVNGCILSSTCDQLQKILKISSHVTSIVVCVCAAIYAIQYNATRYNNLRRL